ncbi:Ig-like domain-containing protein [Pseudoalteromonas sp. PAB 2.2]|uniref:PKD domain-containing protein n=1 Tax=Pseudoalteromonas sp. PAB 2.2 TaxID=1841508 RepID=UPI001179EF3C|nr:hypothetical protein [Pseudoalteromonas sp. PAB 2.2]
MMSPPNSRLINHFKQLLLATSLVGLTACGGSGSDSDEDKKPPVAENKSPTVSISSDETLTEGSELTLLATATDSDGTISTYAWSQISGPDLALSGSDSSSLTITAPAIEDDADVVLSVTVTDDDGATANAQVTIQLKRKVLSVTITGIVTDEPIINSNVAVQIGDELFEITADEQGRYRVDVEVDDSFANKLVKLVALGDNAINPGVEFVSQLKSIATLISQAGEDGTLSKEENFGVNITNVSTAEFALISRDNDTVDSEDALDKALLAIDADEKLLLSALIKIIVDNPDYSLPEGVESTLDLVSDSEGIDDFINTVNSQDPALIETVKETIKDDEELVDNSFGSVVGDYVVMAPKYYTRFGAGQINFNPDGTGSYVFINFNASFSWTQDNDVVSITVPEPVKVSCYFDVGTVTQEEMCEYLTDLDMRILLENDANRTVELYSAFETKNESTTEIISTEELTANRTLIDKTQTLNVAAADLVGSWYVDNTSDFYGYSSAVNFNLVEGGTGTLINNSNAPVEITWSVSDNQLMISSTDESLTFDYSFWFIKSMNVGYQFAASLMSKTDDSSITSTGLFVKDNTLQLTNSDVLGKWTIYQGVNSAQPDLHYDVYDDGLMNFSLNQHYRSWQINSEGVFVRNNYYTDTGGISATCDKPDNSCPVYTEFTQQLLAKDGEHFFTYRKYRAFEMDGTEMPGYYASHIREFSVSSDYGVSRFAPYWWEHMYAEDDTSYRYFSNFYTPKELGVETIELATITDKSSDAFEYSIATTYQGAFMQNSYALQNGKLMSNEWVFEVVEFDRDFLTVCVYSQGSSCTEDAKQAWYFDESMAQEQVVIERPATIHPLDGAWQLADEPEVAVILRDGKWLQIQAMSHPDDETAFAGYEIGDFTWNESTGEFSVQISEDTNGSFGIDDAGAITATVSGDTLTLDIEGEGTITLTRIYSATNPLIGGYYDGSFDSDFFIAVFKEDGTFLELAHDTEFNELGISGGYYSYDTETQKVSVDFYEKTYGSPIEQADPNFIVKAQGNFIHFKDGDDFGIMERVTRVIEQATFTETELVGSHVFTYMADDGSGMQTSNVVISNDGTATFELEGEVREATWELHLGSLMMYSDPTVTQNYGYGVLMTPIMMIDGGFSVETLGFEVPETYDDNDDPALHSFVSGSLIKQ